MEASLRPGPPSDRVVKAYPTHPEAMWLEPGIRRCLSNPYASDTSRTNIPCLVRVRASQTKLSHHLLLVWTVTAYVSYKKAEFTAHPLFKA